MLHHREGDYMLLIVCTALIMTVTGTFDQERQPLGVEMCRYHCGQFNEITFCVYLRRRLACIATWSKHPLQTYGEEAVYLKVTKERHGPPSQRKELCAERQSRIFRTKSAGFRCMKLITEEQTRLLVAPLNMKEKTPLRGFSLLNRSITTYGHINPGFVLSMAYVPTLQKIFIATLQPLKIQAYSLHTDVSVTVKLNMYVTSIVVDDAQQLVFLASSMPYKCITRMTLDGRYFKKINCDFNARVLCLDTRRDILYFAIYRSIYSVTYAGQSLKKVASIVSLRGMTLGENGDVIYYNNNHRMIKWELFRDGREKEEAFSMDFSVKNIICEKGYLYISSMNNEYIHVCHESTCSRLRGANPTGLPAQLITLIP